MVLEEEKFWAEALSYFYAIDLFGSRVKMIILSEHNIFTCIK